VKTWQVILSLIITALLLLIADIASSRHSTPRTITAFNDPYKLTHTARYLHKGDETSPLFEVRFDGPKAPGNVDLTLMYVPITEEEIIEGKRINFIQLRMALAENSLDVYEVFMPPYPRGNSVLYYIKAEDRDGNLLVTLPEQASDSTNTLPFRFEGIAPAWLIVLKASLAIGAILTATLAFFTAFNIIRGWDAINLLGKQILWTTIFIACGEIFFTTLYDRSINGPPGWGGWPFGTFNLHDTMIEIAFIVWICLTVILSGSAFARRDAANLVMPDTAGKLTIGAYLIFAAAVVIY